jgi:UDP-N-acetylglucosamine 1-carboxyvinyltransferase
MAYEYLVVKQSFDLAGTVQLHGAKNAVLVIMVSLLLTHGKSTLKNVPCSDDVLQMIRLLQELGASVTYDSSTHTLYVDTTTVNSYQVSHEVMKKMRASILVMGPLLARFGKADIALPGGDVIGARPINYHLNNFAKMGADIEINGDYVRSKAVKLQSGVYPLEYPSVGATENLMMAAVLTKGITRIINAALEPEVLDLMTVLQKMGAQITILPPATIEIQGVDMLNPVEHAIMYDRLEAGTLLIATAMTGGEIYLPQAPVATMDVFLMKLQEMGHSVEYEHNGVGVRLKATKNPRAVSIKTAPYPGFPTDLQAPMLAAQCVAEGTSVVEETVYENRLLHVRELQKMGAQIQIDHNKATVTGVDELYGANVIATDIRTSAALVLAGLVAKGTTIMTGVYHWKRGYEAMEKVLGTLGAHIELKEDEKVDEFDRLVKQYQQTTTSAL